MLRTTHSAGDLLQPDRKRVEAIVLEGVGDIQIPFHGDGVRVGVGPLEGNGDGCHTPLKGNGVGVGEAASEGHEIDAMW